MDESLTTEKQITQKDEVTTKEAIEATIELIEKESKQDIYRELGLFLKEIRLGCAKYLNMKERIDAAQPVVQEVIETIEEIPTETP